MVAEGEVVVVVGVVDLVLVVVGRKRKGQVRSGIGEEEEWYRWSDNERHQTI